MATGNGETRRQRKRTAIGMVTALVAGLLLVGGGAQAEHTALPGTHLDGVVAITAGWMHSCALDSDGAVFCWGNNHAGQVGDGTSHVARSSPVRVTGFGGQAVRQVSAGADHTCAVTVTNEAWCWGSNAEMQLGTGPGLKATSPVRVSTNSSLYAVSSISAGGTHTCAIDTSGKAWCWGNNRNGELGSVSTMDQMWPIRVQHSGTYSRINAGGRHTCALTSTGTAQCWGANHSGQVGNGDTSASVRQPTAVVAGQGLPSSGLRDIEGGSYHTCAVAADGQAYCWGNNGYGRLGVSGPNSPSPVRVTGGEWTGGAVSISAGMEHTCAVTADGGGWCWGRAALGQVGEGSLNLSLNRPVRVLDRTATGAATGAFVGISAGDNHSCSANAGGRAHCWGFNGLGQGGDGTFLSHRQPSRVFSPSL